MVLFLPNSHEIEPPKQRPFNSEHILGLHIFSRRQRAVIHGYCPARQSILDLLARARNSGPDQDLRKGFFAKMGAIHFNAAQSVLFKLRKVMFGQIEGSAPLEERSNNSPC